MTKIDQNIETIKKNNELFANSLTFLILGREEFIFILEKQWHDINYICDYTGVIEKYIYNYTQELKNYLYNLKKSI